MTTSSPSTTLAEMGTAWIPMILWMPAADRVCDRLRAKGIAIRFGSDNRTWRQEKKRADGLAIGARSRRQFKTPLLRIDWNSGHAVSDDVAVDEVIGIGERLRSVDGADSRAVLGAHRSAQEQS